MTTRHLVRRLSTAAVPLSAWRATQPLPADPILGLVAAFKEDGASQKVNVAQGAYRTDEGLPFVLSSVKEASARVAAGLAAGTSDKEYLPIEGHAEFRRLSAQLVLGPESPALREGRCATLQTISGTGAVSVAATALRLIGGLEEIYVPDPSWGNHQHILGTAGLCVKQYAYLDKATGTTLDFDGMKADLAALPAGAAVLLHACAHNPTGIDPSAAQWDELAALFAARGLLPVFDSAYQVRVTPDPDPDPDPDPNHDPDPDPDPDPNPNRLRLGVPGLRVGRPRGRRGVGARLRARRAAARRLPELRQVDGPLRRAHRRRQLCVRHRRRGGRRALAGAMGVRWGWG